MKDPIIKISLMNNLFFMASKYANKNWRVFIKSKDSEEEVDRSITQEELKFLIAKALDYSSKAKSLKEVKLEFKSLIKTIQ